MEHRLSGVIRLFYRKFSLSFILFHFVWTTVLFNSYLFELFDTCRLLKGNQISQLGLILSRAALSPRLCKKRIKRDSFREVAIWGQFLPINCCPSIAPHQFLPVTNCSLNQLLPINFSLSIAPHNQLLPTINCSPRL